MKTAIQSDLHTLTLCRADLERVIRALRNEAFHLQREVDHASVRHAEEYAETLWEERAYVNAIADDIEWRLPE